MFIFVIQFLNGFHAFDFRLDFCLCTFAVMSRRQSSGIHVPCYPSIPPLRLDFSVLDDILNAEQKAFTPTRLCHWHCFPGQWFISDFMAKSKEGKFDGGPINDESIFRIGSVSRVLPVYWLQCWQKKLININDPVSKYIPELRLKSSVPGDSCASGTSCPTVLDSPNMLLATSSRWAPQSKSDRALSTLKARTLPARIMPIKMQLIH